MPEICNQYAELQGIKRTAPVSRKKWRKFAISCLENPDCNAYYDKLPQYLKDRIEHPIKNSPKKQKEKRKQTYNDYINSSAWKKLRKSIMDERGYKCEKCGATQIELHAHHLTYERFTKELPEDIQILCKPCHKKEHE